MNNIIDLVNNYTVIEIHDKFINEYGYIDCKELQDLEYVVQKLQKVVDMAYEIREHC